MSSLPEEMYLEILLRVPVKSTCVCKCVCKSWSEIISNPSFVTMHLDISTQTKKYNLIFEGYNVKTKFWTLSSISYDSLWSGNGSESEISEMADYPITEMCPRQSTGPYQTRRLLGSCNGLVCVWFQSIRAERTICFCNPATKEYKRIISESIPTYDSIHINAFGYDHKADDYKLIILNESVELTKLLVYALKSNTWKSSQPVPYTFPNKQMQNGTLFNGVFHWLGQARKINSSMLIVVFNVSGEKFQELYLSEELLEKKHLSMTIGVLEGCLCVAVTVSKVCFEVWVMQDYGVQESWTRRYTFDYLQLLMSQYDALKLMPSFRIGHILVRIGFDFFIYDPKHPKGRKPKSLSNLGLLYSVDYVESLVSLNSGTYAGRNQAVGI